MLITILLWLLFGAVVGWLAGLIMGSNFGLVMTIILGIIGSVIGGYIATLLGFGSLGGSFSFNLWNIVISVAGACLLLFIAKLFKK